MQPQKYAQLDEENNNPHEVQLQQYNSTQNTTVNIGTPIDPSFVQQQQYQNNQQPVYPPQMNSAIIQGQSQEAQPSGISQGQGVRIGDFPNHLLFAVPKAPTSRYPQTLFCTQCRRPIDSVVRHEVGTGSLIIGALICCILPYGCCLGPCFLDDCKDSIHLCAGCGSILGKKRFILD